MYHWIEDKAFLSEMKTQCADVVNQLTQAINREGLLEVRQHLVGSGAKNLITQNGNQPIDLDYNLEIVRSSSFYINDGRGIKEYVREKFDEVLERAGWEPCKDSTTPLTTKQHRLEGGNQPPFSIDLCITRLDENGRLHRLIHEKTGVAQLDRYYWNEAPDSIWLSARVEWLKENDCWQELRKAYLDRKNMYLCRNDHDHPSFVVYIEVVNEIYNKYGPGNMPQSQTTIKMAEMT